MTNAISVTHAKDLVRSDKAPMDRHAIGKSEKGKILTYFHPSAMNLDKGAMPSGRLYGRYQKKKTYDHNARYTVEHDFSFPFEP